MKLLVTLAIFNENTLIKHIFEFYLFLFQYIAVNHTSKWV